MELFTQTKEAIAGVGQVLTGEQKPTVTINKPVFFNNGATNVSTNVVRTKLFNSLPAQHRPCAALWRDVLLCFGLHPAWTR